MRRVRQDTWLLKNILEHYFGAIFVLLQYIYTVYKGWCHCLLISCERSLLNTELQSIDDWKIVSLQLRYLTTVFMVYDRHMALYLSNVLLTNAGKRTDK